MRRLCVWWQSWGALADSRDDAVNAGRRVLQLEAELEHARAVLVAFKKRVVVLIEETDALKAELAERDRFEKALVNWVEQGEAQ